MVKTNLTAKKKAGEHYFFGYYDLQPYSVDNKIHLAHKVAFMDRMPIASDIAELCYINTDTLEITPFSTTCAWNFQQGAFLQWYDNGKSVIFNDYDGMGYVSRVVNLSGKQLAQFQRPIASLSRETNKALSVNFSRIYDFRPGYGYCNIPDEFSGELAPKRDGIFLLDINTRKSELIIPYSEMREAFFEPPFTDNKIVVNHITFNPSGTKFVFLLRNFYPAGERWGTVLAVADLKGNIKKLTNFEVNSHYSWRDDENLMIYSGLPEWGIYFINVETGERHRLCDPLCDHNDIHCNYSHDRKRFIGDGYPEKGNERSLYYYDFSTKLSCELFKVYSVPVKEIDTRCDLHARFSCDDSRISYDTTENGTREIMQVIL